MTGHELKATVVEAGFRDYHVEGFFKRELTLDGGSPAEQLGRFVAEVGGDAETVVYALPPDAVTWRTLTLPFRDQRKLAQTVPFELESNVPFALDEVVVDYKVLQRDRAGTTVLAALAPKAEVERHLETLSEAGVDPKIVDAAPLATLNTLSLIPNLPPTFAFIDFGQGTTTVALYRERVLSGVRAIVGTQGGAGGNGSSAAAVEQSVAATVGDVRWTLLALNGAPLEDELPCFVGGGGECVDRLIEPLGEALGLRVERLESQALANVPADLRQRAAEFSATLGTALHEVAPSESIGVNFRRGEFTYHRAEEELRAGLRVVAALALLVVALTVGDLYAEYRAARVRLAAVEKQIYNVFDATVDSGGRVAMPLATLQEEIDLVKQDVQMLDAVVPVANSTSVDILRAVSAAVPAKVRVDSDEYVMDPDEVRLNANTDTFESVDVIKQHLLETGFFSDVQVKDAVTSKRDSGIDFRVVMTLNKSFRPPVGR
jgi:general secretion pathway protein L